MNKTTADVNRIIAGIGLPYAYAFFPKGEAPAPPYLTFFYKRGHDYKADGVNYSYVDELHILHYSAEPNLHGDRRISRQLNDNGLVCEWDRGFDNETELFVTEFVTEVSLTETSEN